MDQFVSIEIKSESYAVITICREPVNSMNLDLWQQLAKALDDLEKNSQVRGVIFQSGLQRDIFTAGNDLMELYAPNTTADRYQNFWVTQNQFFARLYRSPLVTIAAIRGACPAGGCALALCCDYRVMTENGNIGLNEVALGIPVPAYWAQLMVRTIGQRPAERLLQFGMMPSAEEALKLGLVDALTQASTLHSAAEESMLQMLQLLDPGRRATKMNLREDFSRNWEEFCKTEAKSGWQILSHPKTIGALEAVLQKLSKSKK